MNQANKWILAILYSLIFIFLLFCFYSEKVNQDLSDSMIRLHIVANSDSDADQALKLRVRDEVITYMTERMDSLQTKETAGAYVKDHIGELETVANAVIAKEGFSDLARVSFGKYPFPTKQYENVILPAGFYDALKVEIGQAEGQNWWCVMFPPLCFVDDTKGEMEEDYMDVLKQELSSQELDLVLASNPETEIPVEIKFKIVEIFQESKIKLAGLFRGIIRFD
ncbi:MAG: stage II sporulation protein R [Ruminiclostridium sp.]|nr:stage II sporulation protein R [Ruminiclostridium sp.]